MVIDTATPLCQRWGRAARAQVSAAAGDTAALACRHRACAAGNYRWILAEQMCSSR